MIIAQLNKTEVMALKWLKTQGYSEEDIFHNTRASPDFMCTDGKQYEVKKVYCNTLIFTDLQLKTLNSDVIILVFDNENFVSSFFWGKRENEKFKIVNIIYKSKNYSPNGHLNLHGRRVVKRSKNIKQTQESIIGATHMGIIENINYSQLAQRYGRPLIIGSPNQKTTVCWVLKDAKGQLIIIHDYNENKPLNHIIKWNIDGKIRELGITYTGVESIAEDLQDELPDANTQVY
jgi:hypothetical protein